MKKTMFALLVALLSAAACCSIYAAGYKEVAVTVNGAAISNAGIIKDNRTLVPVRGVFEWLDYTIDWNSRTKTARLYGEDYTIEMQSGLSYFTCSNVNTGITRQITPDVPQQIIDGHFYIPLRAVSEAIGAQVSWDSSAYRAVITTEANHTQQSQTIENDNEKGIYQQDEDFKEKPIDYDEFKSDYIKSFLSGKEIEYQYELDKIHTVDLPSEALNNDTLEDLKQFSDLSVVNFEGKAIEDISLATKFVRENADKDISFHLPGDDISLMWLKASNVDEYEDYRNLRKEIVNRVINKGDSDFEKVLAIHDYMVLNTDYDYYSYREGNIPIDDYVPYYVLKNHQGVCGGYTKATRALLNEVGVESKYVSGRADGVQGWDDHAWLIVKVNGSYYHLDVTFDDPVEMPSDYIEWDYFLKSDSTMSEDHKWERNDFPSCYSDYDFTPPYDYYETHPEFEDYWDDDDEYYDEDSDYYDDDDDSYYDDIDTDESEESYEENEDTDESEESYEENEDTDEYQSEEEYTMTSENAEESSDKDS